MNVPFITNCAACVGEKMYAIEQIWNDPSPDETTLRLKASLKETEKLRSGWRYECRACGQSWYLDSEKERVKFIPLNRLADVKKWASGPRVLPKDLLAKADALGFVPAPSKTSTSVPCRVKTQDGTWVDLAVLLQTDEPPLVPFVKGVLFGDEVNDISSSPYAVSQELRAALYEAPETRMGFSIIPALAKGKEYVLNGMVHFIDQDGLKGEDFSRATFEVNYEAVPPVIGEDLSKLTLVYVHA